MALDQGVGDLLDQLVNYADKGLGALDRARTEIQQLQARNAELEARVTQLEGRIDTLRSRLTRAISTPSEAVLLNRPDALMQLIRETLGLKTEVQLPLLPEPVSGLDELSPQQRLEHWIRSYPRTFMPGHPLPLKVGIHEDLQAAEGGDMKKIRRALACYVKVPRYLRCMKAGAVRLDLAGGNAGFVSAEEAAFAHQQLDVLEQQKKQRIEQQRQQERQRHEDEEASRLQGKLSDLVQLHTRR